MADKNKAGTKRKRVEKPTTSGKRMKINEQTLEDILKLVRKNENVPLLILRRRRSWTSLKWRGQT